MSWVVIVLAAIAAAGLIMLVAYGIWLAHKASDVYAELKVLADRSGRIAEVVSRIEIPSAMADATARTNPIADTEPGSDGDRRPDQNATRSAARRAADDVG